MKKVIENSSGNILVRDSVNNVGACGIVEALHLWHKDKSGCVIFAWKVRDADGNPRAEVYSIDDRMANTEYDNADVLLEALLFGQRLANLLIETGEYKPTTNKEVQDE